MKYIFFLSVFFLVSIAGCKTVKPAAGQKQEVSQTTLTGTEVTPPAIDFSDRATWLIGYFNLEQLTRDPYASWYIKGYEEYQFNSEAINKLLEINKDEITIKIVLGTWCPDSRREVPRFMKVLDIWQFPVAKVIFIGVDNAKLSPVGEYSKLDIQRVPTFIIYKNNIEAGRIIEVPTTSLEQDMVNILTRSE